MDFDEFIISKIREIPVRFELHYSGNYSLQTLEVHLDPKMSLTEVLQRVSEKTKIEEDNLELYKCYSNNMCDMTERSILRDQWMLIVIVRNVWPVSLGVVMK